MRKLKITRSAKEQERLLKIQKQNELNDEEGNSSYYNTDFRSFNKTNNFNK